MQRPQIAAPAVPSWRSQPRLDYLDAVRGLAAMTVIGCHYFQAYGTPRGTWLWTYTPLHVVWDGFAAVSMFFVLSGLVLSMRHFRTSPTPDLSHFNLAGYWVARIFRLCVPYIVVLVLTAMLYALLGRPTYPTSPPASSWVLSLWPGHTSIRTLIRQAFLFRIHLPDYFALVPVAWTLSVELVLSMAIPIAVLTAARSTRWLLALSIAMSLGLGLPYIFHFALGTAIAKHFGELRDRFAKSPLMWWGALVIGFVLYTCRYTDWVLGLSDAMPVVWDVVWCATAVGSALILICVISSPRLREVLSGRALRHLGRISYSVYLTHLALIICVAPRILNLLNRHSITHAWGLCLLAIVAATVVISDVLYRCAEVPGMAMGKRLAAYIERRTNSPSTSTMPVGVQS